MKNKDIAMRLGGVVQGSNPSYSGGLQFEASPGKKFVRLHLNQWWNTVALACHPSCTGKHK
jgi:hypothetical protein